MALMSLDERDSKMVVSRAQKLREGVKLSPNIDLKSDIKGRTDWESKEAQTRSCRIQFVEESLVMLCNQYDTVHYQEPITHITKKPDLQLSLWRLQGWKKEVSNVSSRLVQIEAHSLTSKALRHNVELDAKLMLGSEEIV